jgi:hypothetical protein
MNLQGWYAAPIRNGIRVISNGIELITEYDQKIKIPSGIALPNIPVEGILWYDFIKLRVTPSGQVKPPAITNIS